MRVNQRNEVRLLIFLLYPQQNENALVLFFFFANRRVNQVQNQGVFSLRAIFLINDRQSRSANVLQDMVNRRADGEGADSDYLYPLRLSGVVNIDEARGSASADGESVNP